jgi:hypothetical protein
LLPPPAVTVSVIASVIAGSWYPRGCVTVVETVSVQPQVPRKGLVTVLVLLHPMSTIGAANAKTKRRVVGLAIIAAAREKSATQAARQGPLGVGRGRADTVDGRGRLLHDTPRMGAGFAGGRYVAILALSFGGLCVARLASAQDNSAVVESLFDEGKKLAAAGKFAEACPKFLASYNLEHRTGTLLNLADCYEKNGQLASAWARFVEVTTLAQRAGQQERADYGKQHAAALQPRLSMLTIAVPHPAPALQVKRDGVAVDSAAFGVAVAVDAGDHVIEASAPGKESWKSTAHVAGDATTASIEVPALVDAPAAPGPDGAASGANGDQPQGLSGRKIAAIVVAGAGVVSIGVGSVFGVMAIGKKNDSESSCNVGGVANACYPDGAPARHDSAVDATMATVLFAAGGALVAGGVVLWLWPSSSASEAPATVSFDLRGVRVAGSF